MNKKSDGFSFAYLGISGVIKKNRLAMPPHQREFSWTPDKVQQLIDDLTEAKENSRDHFLGTIVAIGDAESENLKIVDGQQRLTSVTLLLAAIRNYLKRDDAAKLVVESIESDCLTSIDLRAGDRVPRLTLNVDDNEFFKNLINSYGDFSSINPSRESHDLLLKAAATCRDWVSRVATTHSKNDIKDRLIDWLEFLEKKSLVVLLAVSDGSRAFKMFETLNDRGLKTSQADLIKSHLFGEVGDARLPEAQIRWSSMRETLQEIDDDDRTMNFLWHATIATRRFSKAEELYDTIGSTVRGSSNSSAYLSDLEGLAREYVATYFHNSERWQKLTPKCRKALQVINFFNPKPMRPLLLAIASKMPDKSIEPALALLVATAVRSIVSGQTRTGSIQETYATSALQVYKGEIRNEKDLKHSLSRIAVADSDFIQAFAVAKISKSALGRYYLHTLESASANESEPWFVSNDDPSQITLEHVMPQKITGMHDWSHVSDDDHRANYKRLGNLCLLQKSPNSGKANNFETSKPIYEASPYFWTSQLEGYNSWGVAEIEERQLQMAEVAVKAWAL